MTGRLAPASWPNSTCRSLLDGAQGVGAVPVDVRALAAPPTPAPGRSGCADPTAPGCSTSAPACARDSPWAAAATPTWPIPDEGPRRRLHEDAQALRHVRAERRDARHALGGFAVLEAAGWAAVHERATHSPREPRRAAGGHGRRSPRADARTLVSFSSPDPLGERERLAERGVILRDIPDRPLAARLGRCVERRARSPAAARRSRRRPASLGDRRVAFGR